MRKEVINITDDKIKIVSANNPIVYDSKLKRIRRRENISSRVRKLGKIKG